MRADSRVRSGERVIVQVASPGARWISALAVLSTFCWLIVLLTIDHHHPDWQPGGRLAWSLTILAVVALIARGIFLGRPVTAVHAGLATAALLAGLAAHVLVRDLVGDGLIVAAAAVLTWPIAVRPNPADLPKVWPLVDATSGDPLAAFAMHSRKCYHFNAEQTAAIAYRTRLGYAVVSGDPIGDDRRFAELVIDFAAMCHSSGWRIVVLGCSQRRLDLWTDAARLGQNLRPVPIGRDVVIDVAAFEMIGRKYRNLRQAVQRTRNCGITTEIMPEQALTQRLRDELTEVLLASPSGARTERGFAMALDRALEGRYPGVVLIIARDRSRRVQGFHRYATAGRGTEVSLDAPWRRRGAPNGIDERLSVDMIAAARAGGARQLSLAFAAFPEIFQDKNRGPLKRLTYTAIHLGDPLIALESLYRYLRKFHALGDRRYVMVSMTQLVPLFVVLLSLEFIPSRRQL